MLVTRDIDHFRGIVLFVFVYLFIDASLPAQSFKRAVPGYEYDFPRDHGAHFEYQTEWWYVTGNLESLKEGDGFRGFGFQFTLFRRGALAPGAQGVGPSPLMAEQVYFAHLAISDVAGEVHTAWERMGRVGLGQARASTETLDAELSGWSIALGEDGAVRIAAAATKPDQDGEIVDAGVELTLRPVRAGRPFVIHGAEGVHRKSSVEGQASHYISHTRLEAVEGSRLRWRGEEYAVGGLAWMDHEFSSDPLGEEQVGWDWFALQMDTGHDLMVYKIRRTDGSYETVGESTLVGPGGEATFIPAEGVMIEALEHWTSPETGTRYPARWRVGVPAEGIELTVTPRFAAQEMRTSRATGATYWEGAVTAEGRLGETDASGVGYVELTGYGEAMDAL